MNVFKHPFMSCIYTLRGWIPHVGKNKSSQFIFSHMPKESTRDYSQIQPYLQGGDFLRQIVVESSHSHQTVIYLLKPLLDLLSVSNPYRKCDDCGKRARYMYYDKDHTALYTLHLWCPDHADRYCHSLESNDD